MERQAAPATGSDRSQEVAAETVAPHDPAPAVDPDAAAPAVEVEPAGDGLWIALLLGIVALLALCVVLTLVAYTRAPVGAPG